MFRPFLFFFALILSGMADERKFHQPFAKLNADEVREMRITVMDLHQKSGKSRSITEKGFIQKLLASVTPKDYPQFDEDDLGMSMPGTLLKVEFIGDEDRPLARIDMLGAWNLLYTRVSGMREPVTGSNRLLCEQLMKQFETLDPEAHAAATTRYNEHISGKAPRELHEMLEER